MTQGMTQQEQQEFTKNFLAGVNEETTLEIMALRRLLYTKEGIPREDIVIDDTLIPREVRYNYENRLSMLLSNRNEIVQSKLN